MTNEQWDQLNDLLIEVADMPLPTWQEKREELELHLNKSAFLAMQEIAGWGWDD